MWATVWMLGPAPGSGDILREETSVVQVLGGGPLQAAFIFPRKQRARQDLIPAPHASKLGSQGMGRIWTMWPPSPSPPSPRKAESTAGPCCGVVPKAPSPCPCAEEGPGESGPTAGEHANKWGFLSAMTLPEGIARTATPMHHQDCESHTGWNEDSQARDQHSPGGGHACWSEKWRKLQRQCWVGGPVWAKGGGLKRHREAQSMRLGGP